MCSKYPNYSKLSSQHNWEDLYDHLISMRNFTLIMSKIFTWTLKIMWQMAMVTTWIC